MLGQEPQAIEHAMKPLLLSFLLLTSSAVSQTPDPTLVDARIRGTVVDADGKPVSHATVYASEEASPLADAYPIATKTDASGRFDFRETLKHGVYELYARKDKDGYPDPGSAFYRALDFNPETVQLFGEHPDAKVKLKLGHKAGVLTGNVVDADTGLPLKSGIVLVNLQADAQRNQVVDGKFRELVPADTDVYVLVQVARPDCANWSRFDITLSLQPGEEKNLDIRLYKNPAP